MSLVSRWTTTATNAANITKNAKVNSAQTAVKLPTDGGNASSNGANNTVTNKGGDTKTTSNSTTASVKESAGVSELIQSNSWATDPTFSGGSAAVNNVYTKGSSRLIDFKFNNGTKDSDNRAYIKLLGNTTAIKDVAQLSGASDLTNIYSALITGYNAFILTSIQENLQEKQSLLPTVGDHFAVTFSGAQPQVIAFSGLLPFDGNNESSWFIRFMNAYNTYLRASVLAKYKCVMRLCIPNYIDYNCYPIGITCGLSAENDTLVNFSVQAVVTTEMSARAYGYSSGALQVPSSVSSAVLAASSAEKHASDIENKATNTAADVGKAANAITNIKNSLNKAVNNATDAINKATSSIGKTTAALGKGTTSKTTPNKV